MISSVSDRDPNSLARNEANGIGAGYRASSLSLERASVALVRIGGKAPSRLSRELASEIKVI